MIKKPKHIQVHAPKIRFSRTIQVHKQIQVQSQEFKKFKELSMAGQPVLPFHSIYPYDKFTH